MEAENRTILWLEKLILVLLCAVYSLHTRHADTCWNGVLHRDYSSILESHRQLLSSTSELVLYYFPTHA